VRRASAVLPKTVCERHTQGTLVMKSRDGLLVFADDKRPVSS